MRSLAAFFLLLAGAAPAFARQDTPHSAVFLQPLVIRHNHTDLNAGGLRHSGNGAGIGAGYTRTGPTWQLHTQVAVAGASLASRNTEPGRSSETLRFAEISAAMLHSVHDAARWRASAGLQLDATVMYRSHAFPAGASEPFADFFLPLSVTGMVQHRAASGSNWSARASLPLGGVAFRTPWMGLKEVPAADLEGPGTLNGAALHASFQRVISNRVSMRGSYGWQLLRHDTGRGLYMLHHTLALGLELRR